MIRLNAQAEFDQIGTIATLKPEKEPSPARPLSVSKADSENIQMLLSLIRTAHRGGFN